MLAPVVDLLLPLGCGGCGAPVVGRAFCGSCTPRAVALALPPDPVALSPTVRAVGAFAYADVVAAAVRAVKVDGRHALLPHLATLLRRRVALPAVPRTWVPAHRSALRARGFDHARALAGDGAVELLERTARRADQAALDAAARRSSPAGSFAAIARVPPAVVLVDDVRTTGATALAAAGALQRGGARRVLLVTLAVGGDDARRAAGGT